MGCAPDSEGNPACTELDTPLLQAHVNGFPWHTADRDDPNTVGYICLSDCRVGYKWHPKAGRCLKVGDGADGVK